MICGELMRFVIGKTDTFQEISAVNEGDLNPLVMGKSIEITSRDSTEIYFETRDRHCCLG